MQTRNSNVRQVESTSRPAFGSALMAGQVVSVMVPHLTLGEGLLAIGDEWAELYLLNEDIPAVAIGIDQSIRSSSR